MKFRTMAAAVAALSLAATPTMAQSSVERASAPTIGASELAGGGSATGLILVAILVGAGLFLVLDNDDDDPDSP